MDEVACLGRERCLEHDWATPRHRADTARLRAALRGRMPGVGTAWEGCV